MTKSEAPDMTKSEAIQTGKTTTFNKSLNEKQS